MKNILYLLLPAIFLYGCSGSDDNPERKDNFNRAAMLTHWADNIIVPSLEHYVGELGKLKTAISAFNNAAKVPHLQTLRTEWLDAYRAWQRVSMFEIGPAETATLRNFTNSYPTDVEQIKLNVASGSYNLKLPSSRDAQGFPALDYLINGIGRGDVATVKALHNTNHKKYLNDLITRMTDMATKVLKGWKSGYRDNFVKNSGSSATASLNKLANDFVFYYEKALRAGKIGIPAGVFSGSPLKDKVEALYHGEASKALFLESLNTTQDFFNGKAFKSATSVKSQSVSSYKSTSPVPPPKGKGLNDYLEYLKSDKVGKSLAKLINDQFDAARKSAANLMDNLSKQVATDNSKMLQTYDALQKNVVLMKTDMFQALNVKVDYVDADGD